MPLRSDGTDSESPSLLRSGGDSRTAASVRCYTVTLIVRTFGLTSTGAPVNAMISSGV